MLSFRAEMEQTSRDKSSNVVLAFDFPFDRPENRENLFLRAEHVLEVVHPYICAAKFNRHLVLPLGLFNGVQRLVKKAHDMGLRTIMDCKINDIGATNRTIAQYYYAAGFDAVIANPFVGWKEGLKPVFDVANKLKRGVILLVYMSHEGASEGYGQTVCGIEHGEKTLQYISFAKKALEWGADGVVVGATYPEKIEEVHGMLRERIPIYSPGIGAQGGAIRLALKAGARYLIVGRTITLAESPAEAAKKVRDMASRHE